MIAPTHPDLIRPVLPIKIIVYSDRPGTDLCLTLESLCDPDGHCPYEVHVVLDWDPQEPTPSSVPCEGLGALGWHLHPNPAQSGFYPRLHATIGAIRGTGAANFCILRQGAILVPGVIEALAQSVISQGYGAVSPVTARLTGCAIHFTAGDTPMRVNAKLRLCFGPGAIVHAPMLDLDVFMLSHEALNRVPFPHFGEDRSHQSLVRFFHALDERGLPLGIRLDAYAHGVRGAADGEPGAGQPTASVMSHSPHPTNPPETRSIQAIARFVEPTACDALEARLRAFAEDLAPRLAGFLACQPVITARETVCVLMSSLMLRGGVLVLVDWINRLILKGLDVRVYVQHMKEEPHSGLRLMFAPKPFASLDVMAGELPPGTFVIATFWTTAETAADLVWRIPGARGYYFIQDHEERFYRDDATEGDYRRRAAASYDLPLTRIVTSRWIADQLAGGDPNKAEGIPRIPVGIDLAVFPPTPRTPSSRVGLVLLAMARPETPRRGYDLLVASLAMLHRRHPLVRIRLFGSDKLSEAELPFPCERIGEISPDQLRASYRDADLFVDASEFQGFGLVPLEAMAFGCACVLTASGGIDEYAMDRINALIVPHDAEAIAEALAELIEEPPLRRALSEAAVETAGRFGRARTADLWLQRLRADAAARDRPNAVAHEARGIVVIVPIFNQLHAARRCIESVLPTLRPQDRLLLIDDHSDRHTGSELAGYAAANPRVTTLRNDMNLGFVGAANRGMAWAGSRNQDMILLNSDTIVVPGWLERLERAAETDRSIGILSPLSTASSHLFLKLPPGQSFLTADRWLQNAVEPVYPTVVTPEGWCFFIRQAVWRRLGGFDPIFGRGYCEESDYCMRAVSAGWRLAVCENLMIYHQGQVTFGAQRSERYRINRRLFDERWAMIYQRIYRDFLDAAPLGSLRASYADRFGAPDPRRPTDPEEPDLLGILDSPGQEADLSAYERGLSKRHAAPLPSRPSVVFVLPELRPFGGILSVVMLVNAWVLERRDVKVVVLSRKGQTKHPDHLGLLVTPLFLYPDASFPDAFPNADLAIGTLWLTLYPILRVAARRPALQIGYFVQDFEADFPDVVARGLRDRVLRTYRWSRLAFAKTAWIRDRAAGVGGTVAQVPPALDIDVFYPRDRVNPEQPEVTRSGGVVAAMLRQSSQQRDPDTLLAVFRDLRERMPDVCIETFGCDPAELTDTARALIDRHHGLLANTDLPTLYARADVFLDTSIFHGFGRVIVEAMACEVACVITASGGVEAFARPETNCLVAAPGDVEALSRQAMRLLQDGHLRARLAKAGRAAVTGFSPRISAERTWETLMEQARLPSRPGQPTGVTAPLAQSTPAPRYEGDQAPDALLPPRPAIAVGSKPEAITRQDHTRVGPDRGKGQGTTTRIPRCNLCGSTGFRPSGRRPDWVCTGCGSRDRTRLLWLYLDRLDLTTGTRILHLAPEKGIYDALIRRVGLDGYETADIDPGRYAFARNIRPLDLCRLEDLPSDHYDLILHSHVLEHTPCEIGYTLRHLHRALTANGLHVCIIPFMSGRFDECFDDIGDVERVRRFGQADHVRRFGREDLDDHLGAVLRFNQHFDATLEFSEDLLRSCKIPEVVWRGLTPETVLVLAKSDLRCP